MPSGHDCQACGERDAYPRGQRGIIDGYYCSPCYAAALDCGIIPAGWSNDDLGRAFRLMLNTCQGDDSGILERFVRLASGGIAPCIDCGAFVDTDDGACRTCCAIDCEEMRRDLRSEWMHG